MEPANRYTCALFLDVDGVLIHFPYPDDLKTDINTKAVELFGNKSKYSHFESAQARSHFLNSESLAKLQGLIARIQEFALVRIVISSEWRRSGTRHQLQKVIFKDTGFAKLIIAKTPQNKFPRELQISRWLQKRKTPFDSVLILDDCRFGLQKDFPLSFVHINRKRLITQGNLNQALNSVMLQLLPKRIPNCKITCSVEDGTPYINVEITSQEADTDE